MPGTVLFLCGSRDRTAAIFAEAAALLGAGFEIIELGWTPGSPPPVLENLRARAAELLDSAATADGILAQDRFSAICAAFLAERSGLAYHPLESIETCAHRLMVRERLRAAGLAVTEGFLVQAAAGFEEALRRAPFPCILKPVRFTGGQGVMRANGPDDFRRCFERLRSMTGNNDDEYFLVEDYVDGDEFLSLAFATGGVLRQLALIDKPGGKEGPDFQDRLLTAPSRHPRHVTAELERTAERAASTMAMCDGPVTVEMRWDGRRAWVLEVNPFPPGAALLRALSPAGPMTMAQVILVAAMGGGVQRPECHGSCGLGYVSVEEAGVFQGLSGVEEALEVPGVVEVLPLAQMGARVVPPPEGCEHAAVVLAKSDKPDGVELALRAALKRVRARILPISVSAAG